MLGPREPGPEKRRPREPPFERVCRSPALGAMAHVSSRKRSKSRSRSRGRGSEKRRKKSSKDAPRSCSASRCQDRKAIITSSGAEGEDRREWEGGVGTLRRPLQAAERASRGGGSQRSAERSTWTSGLKDTQIPEAGPAHDVRIEGSSNDAFCAAGAEIWGLAALLLARQRLGEAQRVLIPALESPTWRVSPPVVPVCLPEARARE